MKKLFLVLICIFVLIGCGKAPESNNPKRTNIYKDGDIVYLRENNTKCEITSAYGDCCYLRIYGTRFKINDLVYYYELQQNNSTVIADDIPVISNDKPAY